MSTMSPPPPQHNLINHGFLICSISFRWNCWLKGFQPFLPRKQQPKQRRSMERSRNPHRCRASASVALHPSVEKSFSSWSSLKYPNNSWVDPVLASSCWLSKMWHLRFLCWSSLFVFLWFKTLCPCRCSIIRHALFIYRFTDTDYTFITGKSGYPWCAWPQGALSLSHSSSSGFSLSGMQISYSTSVWACAHLQVWANCLISTG